MRPPLLLSAIVFLSALPAHAVLSTRALTSASADSLFDQSRLHEVRLTLKPEDWQTLRDNYQQDDYYPANVSLDGVVLQNIGIRSRGSGSRSGEKPGLKLKFNNYVSQDYHGYKNLVLDNLLQDQSVLRERLGFAVFEAMGIPAPYNAYARFYVNDDYFGLYQITEPVDKPFLKARFGEDGGNLFDYQYAFPYDLSFRGDDPGAYIPEPFEPQTNESSLDPSGLIAFIHAVNATPDEAYAQQIGSWLDLGPFITYLAIENATSESDGIVGAQGMNNFYLYQYNKQNRFVFIPWDKDTSFQQPQWPITANLETNVLVRRLMSDPAMQQLYLSTLKRAVISYVNPRWLTPQLESAYRQIRESVLQDPHKPQTNDEFELSVAGLRGIIAARESDVTGQLSEVQVLAVRP